MSTASDLLALLDWKRRVFDVYRENRADPDPARAWRRWRTTRDELFSTHAQTPLPEQDRAGFRGLGYFDYASAARVTADVVAHRPAASEIATSGDEALRFTRFATAEFELDGRPLALELYWLDAYGGGIFLPFADETSGSETYGGGRYLLDTVKGADLGMNGPRLVLDFNFAYNPSCAYDPSWLCPLSPAANRLPLAVRAGELDYPKTSSSASVGA